MVSPSMCRCTRPVGSSTQMTASTAADDETELVGESFVRSMDCVSLSLHFDKCQQDLHTVPW